MAPRPTLKQAWAAVLTALLIAAASAWVASGSLTLGVELALIAGGALALMAAVLPRQRRWRTSQGGAPVDSKTRSAVIWAAAGLGTVLAAVLTEEATGAFLAVVAGLALGAVPCVVRNRSIP